MVGSDPALTKLGQQWYFRNSLSADYQTGSIIDYAINVHKLKTFAATKNQGRWGGCASTGRL
jgi:hypothetical protein